MLGALAGIWTVGKQVGKVAGVVKGVVDNRSDIEKLWNSARKKWDTDGDGKQDVTPQEAMEFVAELLTLLAKRI